MCVLEALPLPVVATPLRGVFCGKCCGTKQYLEYEGVKNMKRERVCDGCIMAPAVAAAQRKTSKRY
jgi:hypothetical protein